METGYSKWRKLDNAALAFPLVTDKNDTRVFRFYCQLKEKVNSDILQQALDQTMEKYPLFQAVLRKGLFWFYLERRDIHAIVKEEKRPPCSSLYIPDKKTLLFQVSYYKNRINFEVYHALTDGTGAMNFLSELVQNYLILAYPSADLPRVEQIEETTPGAQEEDSFSQYYSADLPKNKEKKLAAVKLKGEKLLHADMQITEIVIPVKETLAKARSYGVSITVFLTAMLLCSIHEEIPKNRQKRPIALMIPVNLRNYFPSQSMGNFFGWIEVGYTFADETVFQDVLESVKNQFKDKLVSPLIVTGDRAYVDRVNGYEWLCTSGEESSGACGSVGDQEIFHDGRCQSGQQKRNSGLFKYRNPEISGGVQSIYRSVWNLCKYEFPAALFLFLRRPDGAWIYVQDTG